MRDSFVHNLKKAVNGDSFIKEIVEVGVFLRDEPASDLFPFEPLEHVAYSKRGIPALTVTVTPIEKVAKATRNQKYGLMDQDLCSSKLAKVLFELNEAIAQTIVAPDLKIEGELFGNEGMLQHDKEYLLQILTYLSSNSRAPWFIQRDSLLSTEVFRLLQ